MVAPLENTDFHAELVQQWLGIRKRPSLVNDFYRGNGAGFAVGAFEARGGAALPKELLENKNFFKSVWASRPIRVIGGMAAARGGTEHGRIR